MSYSISIELFTKHFTTHPIAQSDYVYTMMNSIELNTFLNHCPAFCTVLNTLGLESANAQTLHEAITSQHCLQKHLSLVASGDRSLETYYFIFEMGNKLMNCCGYLRIGKRHLYYMVHSIISSRLFTVA